MVILILMISSFTSISSFSPLRVNTIRGNQMNNDASSVFYSSIDDAYPDETPDGIKTLVFLIIGIGDFPQTGENPLRDIDVSDAILFKEKARYYCLHAPLDYDRWKVISLIDNTDDNEKIDYNDFKYYIDFVDKITQSDDRVIFYLATHGYERGNEGYGIYLGDGSHILYNTLAQLLNNIGDALDFYWAAHCSSADVINKMLNSGLDNDQCIYLGYNTELYDSEAYWAVNNFWSYMLSDYDMTVEYWYYHYLRPHDTDWQLFDYYYGSYGGLILGSIYPSR